MKPREWTVKRDSEDIEWLLTNANAPDYYPTGEIALVEKSAYDALMAQAEAMAEAIEFSLKYDSRETEDGFFETDWMILQKALTAYEKFKEQK